MQFSSSNFETPTRPPVVRIENQFRRITLPLSASHLQTHVKVSSPADKIHHTLTDLVIGFDGDTLNRTELPCGMSVCSRSITMGDKYVVDVRFVARPSSASLAVCLFSARARLTRRTCVLVFFSFSIASSGV